MSLIETVGQFGNMIDSTDTELDDAIDKCEKRTEDHAIAEEEYHLKLAAGMQEASEKYGKTMAETMAKGTEEVAAAKRDKDIAAGKERSAVQRVKKIESTRSLLGVQGAWAKNV